MPRQGLGTIGARLVKDVGVTPGSTGQSFVRVGGAEDLCRAG